MPLVRLQKFLADAGVASRRAAERLIVEGQVRVDNEVVRQLGTKVDPDRQEVAVDGQPVRARRKVYVALHKPMGFLCTSKDPESRRVVHDLLPKEWTSLHTVGRLDRDSEGLLFLTNDGSFSLQLTHPRYGVRKRYTAVVIGRITESQLKQFTVGIEDEGEMLKAESVRLLSANNSHSSVELELAEGKNREVRRLFEALGYEVERLIRTQIGPIRLGEMPVGKWRVLSAAEIKSLLPASA
jgi:pseudouridine synthase